MKLVRLISYDSYKGEKNYLNNQRFYEICRTVLLFGISFAVFGIGYLTTGSNKNLLTIIAVLGLLPSCKSLVSVVMFARFKSCESSLADRFEDASKNLPNAFDRVFTSSEKTYMIYHLVLNSGCLVCYSDHPKMDEQKFIKHITGIIKADGFKDVTVKVYSDPDKYIERIEEVKKMTATGHEDVILNTLLNVSL